MMHVLRLLAVIALLAVGSVGQAVFAQAVMTEAGTPDYSVWDVTATRAEEVLEAGLASTETLETLRGDLDDWRVAFLAAQNTNAQRIETLRNQITALGEPPAEGEPAEAPEIADRRATLQSQLTTALAPVRQAEEAFTRADGLIDQLDGTVRDLQAERFLELGETPVNPVLWPEATREFTGIGTGFLSELSENFASDAKRTELVNNLPVILVLLIVGLGLILRSGRWIDSALNYVRERDKAGSARFRVGVFVLSLVSMLLPILGLNAFIQAVNQSQLFGTAGQLFLDIMTRAVISIFLARWLGRQVFPAAYPPRAILPLDDTQNRKGRVQTVLAAILVTAIYALDLFAEAGYLSAASRAVWTFPVIVLIGLTLYRISRLLRATLKVPEGEEAEPSDTPGRLILSFLYRACLALAIVSPLLTAIGYLTAGTTLAVSSLLTLGLLAVVVVLQRFIRDLYAAFIGDDRSENALVPVLLNFVLTLASLPIVALIWGARGSDLTETWALLAGGFQLGNSRISPVDFLTFAIVFFIGYMLTRLFQGALRTQVLPKTRLDMGGRNAIVSGTGYIGIFLAAVIAISTAGIDLSSLAIVAGALSVGIGFGLQTIVSNFVSGIILLIERPISEGDWIEVGGTMGVVKDISVRATRIETFDRRDVIVPNADLISTSVTNWTKGNMTGRIIIPVGVAYGSDTRKVETILREVAEANPVVILSPPPSVVFIGFGADSLDFEIRAILRDVNFSLSAQSDMRHEIVTRFEAAGVEMPFAQRDIWLRNPEVLPTGEETPE